MSDLDLLKDPKTGAFAETVRKLCDIHTSDLRRLESENQTLRIKLRSLEVEEEVERGKDRAETLHTQSIPSDDEPVQKYSTLKHQPKSAWARVVPQTMVPHESENDLFHHSEHEALGSSKSIWKLVENLVSHPMFDVAAAALIFINAVVMAMESQWEGLSVGASLQYASLNANHTAAWISAEPIFVILGYVFGVLFTLELFVKIVGQRWKFCGHLGAMFATL